jgi:hypothetical protein
MTSVSAAAMVPPTGADWTTCAIEGGTCTVSGTRKVRFGANGVFATRTVTGAIACTTAAFGGDPAYRVLKSCAVSNAAN